MTAEIITYRLRLEYGNRFANYQASAQELIDMYPEDRIINLIFTLTWIMNEGITVESNHPFRGKGRTWQTRPNTKKIRRKTLKESWPRMSQTLRQKVIFCC